MRAAVQLADELDCAHYVERQLKPIAAIFVEALGTDLERLFEGVRQLWLFQ